jgi:hypothetical protein
MPSQQSGPPQVSDVLPGRVWRDGTALNVALAVATIQQRDPGRFGQLAQQVGQFLEEQAVQVSGQVRGGTGLALSLPGLGTVGLSGIGHHPPLLGSRWKPASAVGALELTAVGPAGPLLGQPLGAFGAAGDGGHPPLRRQPALGIELHHSAVTERLDLLGPTQPHPLLRLGATPGGELARVERHEHRVKRRRSRRAGAFAGGGDGALADGFGVAGRHAEAVAGEGLAQRRPSGAQLLGGGVDAAQPLGQGEGAFGFAAVGEEAAGLPAQRVAIVPAPRLGSALDSERVLSRPTSKQYSLPRGCGCGRQPEPGGRSPVRRRG